jgi:hypothetical protein
VNSWFTFLKLDYIILDEPGGPQGLQVIFHKVLLKAPRKARIRKPDAGLGVVEHDEVPPKGLGVVTAVHQTVEHC